MATIDLLGENDAGSASRTKQNSNDTNLNTDKAEISGQAFTGKIQFTGTTFAGIQLISLTTVERDALTPINGDLIYNETDDKVQMRQGGAWVDVTSVAADASKTVKGIVEIATEAQIEAGTTTGETGALIVIPADTNHVVNDNQKAAIAGTSGTPSGSNKFITADDVSDAAGSGKVVRADGTALPALDGSNLTDVNIKTDSLNAGETINGATLPVAIYVDDTTNEGFACDGNDLATLEFMGFAVSNSTDGNPIDVKTDGVVSGFTGLDIGKKYYVQDDKTIGTSIGTAELLVGVAISATELVILHGNFEFISSASDSADVITVPDLARIAVIEISALYASVNNITTHATLTAKGKLIANFRFDNDGSGVSSDDVRFSATWDVGAKTITLSTDSSDTSTVSGTAYFYR